MVELDAGEIARVAGDVGDDEAGGFGLVEHGVPDGSVGGPHHRPGRRPLSSGIVSAWLRRRRSSGSTGTRSRSRTRARSTSRRPGHTKLDLVQLLPGRRGGRAARRRRPADGAQALRGRRRRPAVLPEARARRTCPTFIRTATLTFPSGPDRRRDRHRRRGGARLGHQPRLHRPQPAPGPRRRPRPPRRAARRPRPGAGRRRGRRSARSRSARASRSRRSGWSAGPRPPARAASTSTSGSSRAGRSRRSAARRSPWPATSSGGRPSSRPRNGGRRSATASSSTTTRTPRTGPWLGLLRPAAARRARLDAADLGRGPDRRGRGVHDRHRARALRRDRRPGGRHRRGGRVARGAAGAERARRGRGPGRRAVAAELREAGRRAAAGPAIEGAQSRKPSTSRGAARRAAAARGRRGTGGRGGRRRPERGPPDRVGRLAADADRPAQDVDPGRRDRAGGVQGRGARGARALEGAAPGGRAVPRAGGHPGRRDARPVGGLVPRPGQPHPRARGGPAGPGAARIRLRPVGRPGHRGLEGGDQGVAGADAEAEGEVGSGVEAAVSRCRRSWPAGTARSPRAGRSGRPPAACPGASA